MSKCRKSAMLFPDTYIHRFIHRSDSGLRLNLLQEYVFIALDIFKNTLDNKDILTIDKLDAWLTFLSVDDPDTILQLIQAYPAFEHLYREVYELCLNLERMMEMFSKELFELNKNTVQYMIDEMQDIINEQKDKITEQNNALVKKDNALREQDSLILSLQTKIELLKSRRP